MGEVTQAQVGPRPSAIRQLLMGGLLPVIAYTIIDETQGPIAGLIAGMALGVAEILYERLRFKRVDPITWGGNGLLLVLGGVSLATQSGVWFKLQPSILELASSAMLVASLLAGRGKGGSFLLSMSKKQGQWSQVPDAIKPTMAVAFRGLTLRLSVFLTLHAAIAAWAALDWSTRAWAILKGVGFTVTFALYLMVEIGWLRYKLKHKKTTYEARPEAVLYQDIWMPDERSRFRADDGASD